MSTEKQTKYTDSCQGLYCSHLFSMCCFFVFLFWGVVVGSPFRRTMILYGRSEVYGIYLALKRLLHHRVECAIFICAWVWATSNMQMCVEVVALIMHA